MYIYVLYVSCFAFFRGTDVGICREVFTARHKGGMMHHHHNCTGTIYHLPITRYNLILSNKKNAPQKPSESYAWKTKGFSQIRKMHLRNLQNLMRERTQKSQHSKPSTHTRRCFAHIPYAYGLHRANEG